MNTEDLKKSVVNASLLSSMRIHSNVDNIFCCAIDDDSLQLAKFLCEHIILMGYCQAVTQHGWYKVYFTGCRLAVRCSVRPLKIFWFLVFSIIDIASSFFRLSNSFYLAKLKPIEKLIIPSRIPRTMPSFCDTKNNSFVFWALFSRLLIKDVDFIVLIALSAW